MRGLLFPGLTDDVPDETELLAHVDVVKKTIDKFLTLWNIELPKQTEDFSTNELQALMEIITNVNIIFTDSHNQENWLKSQTPLLNGKSSLELMLEFKFNEVKIFTRNALL